jgi:hypothetical protein
MSIISVDDAAAQPGTSGPGIPCPCTLVGRCQALCGLRRPPPTPLSVFRILPMIAPSVSSEQRTAGRAANGLKTGRFELPCRRGHDRRRVLRARLDENSGASLSSASLSAALIGVAPITGGQVYISCPYNADWCRPRALRPGCTLSESLRHGNKFRRPSPGPGSTAGLSPRCLRRSLDCARRRVAPSPSALPV